ncbi:MAG: dihydrolipoyl dehydrogenase [Hyphomicrobiaceae bacterium]|nr:dihydrolipoyl dehydrogenase [Hyphomicrobiaceae bacterium]
MSYDLTVIGTGPGGYVCAIRAAQLGMKVAVIEKRATHGGTCLNVGCIPSKALLHASELYEEANHGFAAMGIGVSPTLDLTKMMKFKSDGVKGNVDGISFLLKKNKIDVFNGIGKISNATQVCVTSHEGTIQTLDTKRVVIATGSDIASLPGIDIDEKTIVSSTGALNLGQVPERMLVVGGGVIGLELGSVWRRLGAKVQVVEFLDRIIPDMDGEISKQFQRVLQKQGMTFKFGTKVTGVSSFGSKGHTVTLLSTASGNIETIEVDVVLIATGRVPYTHGLGLEEVGVEKDELGRVKVSPRWETSVPGIFAIGDVIDGPMLAHKAEDEGVAVAELLAGQAGHVNYNVIPGVVYTNPEVASVGKTEEQLKEAGIAYNVGKFPFMANGRAKVNRTTDGFVKILADATTDRVLGAHMIGPHVGELISEAAVLMEFSGSAEDLARICHAHPTLNEAVKEAALAVDNRALHM